MTHFKDGYIYRLTCPRAWDGIARGEHVPYEFDDSKSGYFHLSAPSQVFETAKLHYSEFDRLYAVGCPEGAPGELLKWEESRNGEVFPHIHGDVLTRWFDHIVPLVRQGSEYVIVHDGDD